jgi:hypothetical protein
MTVVALAALMLGFAATPVLAANAVVTQDSVVREDPDNTADIVNEVSEGDEVTVTDCQDSYCFIKIPGDDGWIRQNRLGALDEDGGGDGKVPFSFSFGVGPDGKPSFSVGVGNTPKKPPVIVLNDEACFFKNKGFSGPSFCVDSGDDRKQLGPFDDSISSIKLSGDAEVTVCRNKFMAGSCSTITSSKSSLSPNYDNRISSLEVN